MPSLSFRAFDSTSDGSTCVAGTCPANAAIAACITSASAAQSLQQLWNSLRRRTTSRERDGSSRSIFTFAAA